MARFLKNLIEAGVEKGGRIVKDAEQRTYGTQIPDGDVTEGPGGDIIIKAMEDDDFIALNKALEEGGFEGGLNLGRIGEIFDSEKKLVGPPEVNEAFDEVNGVFDETIDPSSFDIKTVLQNIKNNNVELFEHLRREKKSITTLMAIAEQTGFEKIVYKLLGRKPGEVLPAEDVLGGLVALIKLGKEMEYGARKALNMSAYLPEQQAAKEEAFKKLKIMATIQSNLAAQVSGNVSEYGRGLAVISAAQKAEGLSLTTYADNLNNFISEMDDGLIDYHLHTFLRLQTPAARAKYAEKGWAAKTYDFAMENYINALLSSPVTHMINMAGNATFQGLSLAERGLAELIGNVRTMGGLRGDVGDNRFMGEAAAEAYGLAMGLRDAFVLMSKTMVTGESPDMVTKIDLRETRALGSTDNLLTVAAGINQGDYTKSAIDLLGIATRLPGRFLATEDEFFKVISRRRVLYREAHRAAQIAYTGARKTMVPREKARALAEAEYLRIMTDTPEEVDIMMTKEAQKLTFQGAPEGFFGQMGPTIQRIPGMKIVVPFYNTPTNVINEAIDRTVNWSPIYRGIKQSGLPGTKFMPKLPGFVGGNKPVSGVEFDDALSKLALGNFIALAMYNFANGDYGDDVIVTGGGPENFSTKINIMGSANVPPYSIGIKQEDGQYKFVSFSRFDPLSAMLAMGADMAQYMRYEDDPSMAAALSKAYTLGAAEYAGNMPFLQGVSEFTSAAGGSYQTKEDLFERISKWAGSQVASVGTNVVGNLDRSLGGLPSYAADQLSGGKYPLIGQNSFYATMERLNNPIMSNTMLPPGREPISGTLYTEAPAFMQGFYLTLQKAKSRNPDFSPELPQKISFWGDIKKAGTGKLSESWNPFKIQIGGYTPLDEELIRLSETGNGSFSFHSKRVNTTLLNGVQYNNFVTSVNTVDGKGRMLGDLGYNPDDALLPALNEEMNSLEYSLLPTDEDRFDALNSILSARRQGARKFMVISDPQLNLLDMAQ